MHCVYPPEPQCAAAIYKITDTNQREVYSCWWTWGYAARVRGQTADLPIRALNPTPVLKNSFLYFCQKHNLAKFSVQHSSHWQDSTRMQPSLSRSYLLEALQLHQFHHFGNIHNAPILWHSQGFYPKRPKISKAWAALRAWEDCKLHGQRRVYRWIGCLGVTCLQYALTGRNSGKTMWEADMNAFTWDVGQNMPKCGAIEVFFHIFIPSLVRCHYKAHVRRCQHLWWCVCTRACVCVRMQEYSATPAL